MKKKLDFRVVCIRLVVCHLILPDASLAERRFPRIRQNLGGYGGK